MSLPFLEQLAPNPRRFWGRLCCVRGFFDSSYHRQSHRAAQANFQFHGVDDGSFAAKGGVLNPPGVSLRPSVSTAITFRYDFWCAGVRLCAGWCMQFSYHNCIRNAYETPNAHPFCDGRSACSLWLWALTGEPGGTRTLDPLLKSLSRPVRQPRPALKCWSGAAPAIVTSPCSSSGAPGHTKSMGSSMGSGRGLRARFAGDRPSGAPGRARQGWHAAQHLGPIRGKEVYWVHDRVCGQRSGSFAKRLRNARYKAVTERCPSARRHSPTWTSSVTRSCRS